MPRRLPVYLLLDVSGSMTGEPIESVRNGVQQLISELRKEPQALETAYLSVITFESVAKQVVPLTDLISFQEPHFEAGGATELGAALELVVQKINSEVIPNTPEQKGDYKPLVFLMTDGEPTDNWMKGAELIKNKKINLIACAAGYNANSALLRQITENVVELKSASSNDIKAFFKWVTQSTISRSKGIDSGKEEGGLLSELPPPPPELNIVP